MNKNRDFPVPGVQLKTEPHQTVSGNHLPSEKKEIIQAFGKKQHGKFDCAQVNDIFSKHGVAGK
jgi:hypothetical protein